MGGKELGMALPDGHVHRCAQSLAALRGHLIHLHVATLANPAPEPHPFVRFRPAAGSGVTCVATALCRVPGGSRSDDRLSASWPRWFTGRAMTHTASCPDRTQFEGEGSAPSGRRFA